MFNLAELKQRRQQLLKTVDQDTIIILISARERRRNGDVHYPYRQDSDFYYLTAFPEPEAIALLLPESRGEKYILFSRPSDPLHTVWQGESIGQERARTEYGADESHPISQLEALLPEYALKRRHYYCLGASDPASVRRIRTVLATLKQLSGPQEDDKRRPSVVLHDMRLKKSPDELICLQKAATVSSQAHNRAMQICQPGLYEYQLEAELLYTFYQAGCRSTAYPSIVASGYNACILHYTANDQILNSGELVLIDAGCEYQSYASDITRCFPVNGRFSPEQKAIYNIVLEAQKGVLGLIKPGVSWDYLQTHCARIITEGLCDLGLLQGDLNSLMEQHAYKRFYMHSCSHWLGLDVHDVGGYKWNQEWRRLEANMVFTVEPGLYITANTPDVPEQWWNIGVRIEDDVCVTEQAYTVLSHSPKEIADVESLMRS